MFRRFPHLILISFFVLISFRLTARDENAKPPASDPDLASADQLFRAGKFAAAETSYQAILLRDSKLVSSASRTGALDVEAAEN